jgi:hypothetical protein
VHVATANPSIPQEISHARPAGVDVAEDVDKTVTVNLAAALGPRRAWGRAAKVMASPFRPPPDRRRINSRATTSKVRTRE